jgi:hypothetical protein
MSGFVGNIEDNVDGNNENGNRTTELIMNKRGKRTWEYCLIDFGFWDGRKFDSC